MIDSLRHRPLLPMLLLFGLMLLALLMMSDATQHSERFNELYFWLLVFSAGGLVLLTVLIGVGLYQLMHRYRQHEPGSRLSLRLMVLFVALALVPVGVVYHFSLQFLQRGIDSWFDVRIEDALNDALELGRSALDLRMREALKQTQRIAEDLRQPNRTGVAMQLDEMLTYTEATELTLFGQNGRIIATASLDPLRIVPHQPPDIVFLQVRQGHDYLSLDPIHNVGFHIRVMVPVPSVGSADETRMLQALFPVPSRLGELADSVQSAFDSYRELKFLRNPLKTSFILTLSLVLLFGVLAAFWAALYAAQRLVAPIRELAEGTRAVAAGDYDRQLPLTSNDELGFLVHSFNQMTRNLAHARLAEQRSQQLLKRQRTYLQAVLARLSSGVLTFDHSGCLRTYNIAAEQILHTRLGKRVGRSSDDHPPNHSPSQHIQRFFEALKPWLQHPEDWRQEVTLFAGTGRLVLMCRGSSLPDPDRLRGGHVVVFDDITALVQAQRDAAWAEVARRLAHEIKNPLTPIQLATERIRHKYLKQMEPEQARVLDRGTQTIIQQVQSMKEIVNDFNNYARPTRLNMTPIAVNRFISELLYPYRSNRHGIRVVFAADTADPTLMADASRLRQLLHNLIQNSLEALSETGGQLTVCTRVCSDQGQEHLQVQICDDGPGFPDGRIGNMFEPYVTTKPKGTGLGLAIVRKIVDEHGGLIDLANPPEGGAQVTIRLPLNSPSCATTEENKA